MTAPLVPPAINKPRYDLLDGLRGVGAMLVILFHFGEAFASDWTTQMINHGYLAVDFFFILSGFVIGYAYDSRWNNGMTAGRFMLRRLIRLHPMVILAAVLGVAAYLLQGSVRWDGTPAAPCAIVIALVLGLLMIPAVPNTIIDVRGNAEMFPLNGPQWSLFFEYIGSLLYAILLHRLSTRWLRIWVIISGIGVIACTMANFSGGYTMGYGWSILGWDIIPCGGFVGGFMQMSFCFGLGLLMTRGFKAGRHIRGAFWLCAGGLVLICSAPYLSIEGGVSRINGIYDLFCTIIILPTLVWLGAHGITTDRFSTSVCEWMGKLSYPVYIVHYPIMYLFYNWIWSNKISFNEAIPTMIVIFLIIPIIAWVALKFYDEPVRRYLSSRWLSHQRGDTGK